MSRRKQTLPYYLGRFNYWHLHIAAPFRTPAAWGPHPPSSSQESQDDIVTQVLAILEGQDSPEHPDHQSEHDRHVHALKYWISLDRLWYQFRLAQDLLNTLPARQKQALNALSQRRWAPKKELWTWDTLLPRIARDQMIFRQIVELGPTRAGVAHDSDRAIARDLFKKSKDSKATAHTIYVEYSRQTSILLGRGALPRRDWAAWLREAGTLNRQSRMHAKAVLADIDEAYHWFAHALRNLTRYRDRHPPLAWLENPTSCSRRCQKALDKLIA